MYTSIRCTCLKIFKKCYIRYSTALQLGTGHWATDQNPYIYLYRTAIPGTAYRKLKVLLSMIYSQPIIQYIFFGLANRCPEQSRVCTCTHTQLAVLNLVDLHVPWYCMQACCTVPITGRKTRTLELLAFDEYCRFDTSAFF